MPANHQANVLVVGAGPVGMFTALRLAQRGIGVHVIDRAARPATRSYACGLHTHTLKLFRRAGVADEILEAGHRLNAIGFYEGGRRKASIDFAKVNPDGAGFVVLPQCELERLLEARLREVTGEGVRWNHRLASLHLEDDFVSAHIDKLGDTVTGYIVPHWESVVLRSLHETFAFVVGADGHESFVRRALGIPYEQVGEAELYVVYEFDSDAAEGDEACVVLDRASRSVFWPLTDGRCRWSFRWSRPDDASEFPTKDHNVFWVEAPDIAQRTKEHLQQLLRARAPWFAGGIGNMDWAIDVQFERRLAARFGRGRCLLAGDAAHQAGPVGMQSMNVGFREGEKLAELLHHILREGAPLELLGDYDRAFHSEWELLQGVKGRLKPIPGGALPCVQETEGLVACLPASGEDHGRMLRELGYELQ